MNADEKLIQNLQQKIENKNFNYEIDIPKVQKLLDKTEDGGKFISRKSLFKHLQTCLNNNNLKEIQNCTTDLIDTSANWFYYDYLNTHIINNSDINTSDILEILDNLKEVLA